MSFWFLSFSVCVYVFVFFFFVFCLHPSVVSMRSYLRGSSSGSRVLVLPRRWGGDSWSESGRNSRRRGSASHWWRNGSTSSKASLQTLNSSRSNTTRRYETGRQLWLWFFCLICLYLCLSELSLSLSLTRWLKAMVTTQTFRSSVCPAVTLWTQRWHWDTWRGATLRSANRVRSLVKLSSDCLMFCCSVIRWNHNRRWPRIEPWGTPCLLCLFRCVINANDYKQ